MAIVATVTIEHRSNNSGKENTQTGKALLSIAKVVAIMISQGPLGGKGEGGGTILN